MRDVVAHAASMSTTAAYRCRNARHLDPVRLFTERITAMPIITVQQSPRPLEAKRRLVAGITDAFVDAYGVRPEHVQIFIDEVGHENWAKGGKLAVDNA